MTVAMSLETLYASQFSLTQPMHCRLDSSDAGREQLGIFAVSGPDAGKFLQGQLTCDVLALTPGQQTLGASCTPQGRMRGLFRLLRRDEDFLLLMPRSVVPQLLEALKKYAVFFKAQLRDASMEFQIWGLLGAERQSGGWSLPELAFPLPVSRQLLLLPQETTAALPGQLAPASQWFCAELLVGEPAVYPETVEKLLPHHVNLPAVGGVSFNKGCYTGQEIVARMEFRGKIKTHMHPASAAFAGEVLPGTAVRNADKDVGEVVRAVASGKGQLLLLSMSDQAAESADSGNLHLALPEEPILELHR